MVNRMLKCFLLFFAVGFLEAQAEQSFGSGGFGWCLYHEEGTVVLVRDGIRTTYHEGSKEALQKITLKTGDLIQTTKGKAEIQMVPDKSSPKKTYTVIKLRDNTTVQISDNQGKRERAVELLYGRMRVITGSADSAITVRAGTSAAALQNGDAAVDFIAKMGVTQPVMSFHCFNGKGEFVPQSASGTKSAPLSLKSGETFLLESSMSNVGKKPIEEAVITYWDIAPFTEGSPLPSPAVKLASTPKLAETQKEPSPVTEKQKQQQQKQQKEKQPKEPRPPRSGNLPTLKDGLAIAGLLLTATGAAMQAYTFLGNPDPSYKNKLFNGAYIPLGAGVALILGSSLFSSKKAASD